MWSALWTALLIGLPALLVNAQTETVVNAAGQTVVEVISLNAAGIPETQILSTVLSSSSAASSSTAALTSSTTPAVTTPTTTPPAVQGPVGQPAPTALAPTPTQYVYTTTNALGQTTAVQDVFTPSFAPTTTPAPGTSGTIINFSEYLSAVGTNTVRPNSASTRWGLYHGWYGAAIGALTGIISGVYLVLA